MTYCNEHSYVCATLDGTLIVYSYKLKSLKKRDYLDLSDTFDPVNHFKYYSLSTTFIIDNDVSRTHDYEQAYKKIMNNEQLRSC